MFEDVGPGLWCETNLCEILVKVTGHAVRARSLPQLYWNVSRCSFRICHELKCIKNWYVLRRLWSWSICVSQGLRVLQTFFTVDVYRRCLRFTIRAELSNPCVLEVGSQTLAMAWFLWNLRTGQSDVIRNEMYYSYRSCVVNMLLVLQGVFYSGMLCVQY